MRRCFILSFAIVICIIHFVGGAIVAADNPNFSEEFTTLASLAVAHQQSGNLEEADNYLSLAISAAKREKYPAKVIDGLTESRGIMRKNIAFSYDTESEEFVKWAKLAVEDGWYGIGYFLGSHYAMGSGGVKKDLKEALRLFELALKFFEERKDTPNLEKLISDMKKSISIVKQEMTSGSKKSCEDVYVGKEIRFPNGSFLGRKMYITAIVIGYSEKSGLVTVRSTETGETAEIRCDQLP